MAVFTNVSNTVLEPGDPIRSVDIIAIKENTNFLNNKHTTNVQTFNASGIWTKPTVSGTPVGTMARIQIWAGGGGGGRGTVSSGRATGGGGGGYNEITVPLSTLDLSVTVTIGAGGVGRTGSVGNGTTGGNSSFGALLSAFGGGGGYGSSLNLAAIGTSGGGGGQLSAGSAGGNVDPYLVTGRPRIGTGPGPSSLWHGGTLIIKQGPDSTDFNFGDAVYGGGAGSWGFTNTPGLSVYGGNGGAQNQAGTQPAGGGGCSSAGNGDGFSGGAGRCVVTVW